MLQEELQDYSNTLRQKVGSLKAEARSAYIGPPPAQTTTAIPTVPVLNKDQPLTILPEGPQDGRGSAESVMSRMSKRSFGASSQKSLGAMSKKSSASKGSKAGPGGRKKRPLSKRLSNPLHDRFPKFPAYMETREEQFQTGSQTHKDVMTVRASFEKWGRTPFSLDAVDILRDPIQYVLAPCPPNAAHHALYRCSGPFACHFPSLGGLGTVLPRFRI